MKIKYTGPSPGVNVGGRVQKKDEVIDYPDDFAKELLLTSKKQKFVCVDKQEESIGKPGKKAQVKTVGADSISAPVKKDK